MNENITPLEEASAQKIKKKSSLGKKILISLLIILLVICLLMVSVVLIGYFYIDSKLDLISYEQSDEEWSINSEAIESDEEILSFEQSVEISVIVPPISQEPSFEPMEEMFDGDNISDSYEDQVINILLIGSDNAASLSDVMMLLSINPVKERIVLTSFLRDSYVQIPGLGYNKLNVAHAYGGNKLLIETLEYHFGIDIDNFARVNFSSFKAAVDALGGVELVINKENYNYFYNWPEFSSYSKSELTDGTHTIHLNGEEALGYARNRNYSDGDFTRTLHQRDFISQFINNCKSASLTELDNMLTAVLPYVSTDMKKGALKSLLLNAVSYLSYDMEKGSMPCAGTYYGDYVHGRSVIMFDMATNVKYVKAQIYG